MENSSEQPPHSERLIGLRGGIVSEDHRQRMGDAIWLFMWCVRAQTSEENGVGAVYGGSLITYAQIERETRYPKETIRRWMNTLQDEGYIRVDHPGRKDRNLGVLIWVLNAKKFGELKAKEGVRSDLNGRGEGVRSDLNGRSVQTCTGIKEERQIEEEKEEPPPTPSIQAWEQAGSYSADTWERKHGGGPAWTPMDYGRIGQLFADASLTLERWCRHWENYLASSEEYGREGHTLKFFIGNFDKFVSGPIGGTNATHSANPGPTRAERNDAALVEGAKRLGVDLGIDGMATHVRTALPASGGQSVGAGGSGDLRAGTPGIIARGSERKV